MHLMTTLNIPRPHLWQYIWLISALASICGLLAMNKNYVLLMKIFFITLPYIVIFFKNFDDEDIFEPKIILKKSFIG